jgi:formylglycine-generating enzyme
MADIIGSIAKLLPFESWGMKRTIAEPLSIVVLTGLAVAASWAIKILGKRFKEKRTAIDAIIPQFDGPFIKRSRKYFIATYGQNASPSRQEEPGFTHLFVARVKLIPFFIKTAFNHQQQTERFYLILGDSGMGKTTFLLNLYLQYHDVFNRHRQLKMRLFRMSEADTLKVVDSIPISEAKETILLLDALDEDSLIYPSDPDTAADKTFRDRMDSIIKATASFIIVVLSCRSQYFPGQEEDPYELKIRRADEKGFYQLNKLYLSPFTSEEVDRYLRKRFGRFFSKKKRERAHQIIGRATNLVMRPMLLSYIEYLVVDEKSTYQNILSIYEALVANWLKREAEKRKPNMEQGDFINNLYTFSRHIAVEIYRTWKKERRLSLDRKETMELAKRFDIRLSPHELTGQSLLTCDGSGHWKFAHRSIMEYFLATELERRPEFFREFVFEGQDMVLQFYMQMSIQLWPLFYTTEGDRLFFGHTRFETYSESERNDTNKTYTFTIEEAKEYCDYLNVSNNYPRRYKKYDSISNNHTIPGFHLPTSDDYQTLFSWRPAATRITSMPDFAFASININRPGRLSGSVWSVDGQTVQIIPFDTDQPVLENLSKKTKDLNENTSSAYARLVIVFTP